MFRRGDPDQPTSRFLTDFQILLLLLGVIAVAYDTGLFTGARMTAFGQCVEGVNAPIMRFARTLMCALFAFVFWTKQGIRPTLPDAQRAGRVDRVLLAVAFGLTVVADFFIIVMPELLALEAPPIRPLAPANVNPTCVQKEVGWPFLVGTALFMGVHAVLIGRHALGWREAWRNQEGYKRKLLISAAAVYLPGAWFLWKVAPALGTGGNDLLERVYFAVLLTGLWMAIGALYRKAFPVSNTWLIVIGMAFFVFTDVALGLSHILTSAVCGGYTGFPLGALGALLEKLHEWRLLPLSDCLFDTPVVGPDGQPVNPFHLATAQFLALVPDLTYSPALVMLGLSAFSWPGFSRDDSQS